MADYFRSDCVHDNSEWNSVNNQTSSLLLENDPVLFYSTEYEQSVMDKYLTDSPSPSQFMSSFDDSEYNSLVSHSSSDECILSEVIDSEAELMNTYGNNPYNHNSIDYEQTLIDQYLPSSLIYDDYSDSMPLSSDFQSTEEAIEYEEEVAEEEFIDVAYGSDGETLSYCNYYTSIYITDQINNDICSESSSISRSPSPIQEYKPIISNRFTNSIKMHGGDIRKRGRPTGSKSNTKMAVYGKQYREMKKNEVRSLSDEVSRLTKINKSLQTENKRLSNEVKTLRNADSINAQLSVLLVTLKNNPGKFRLCINPNGTPVLEVV